MNQYQPDLTDRMDLTGQHFPVVHSVLYHLPDLMVLTALLPQRVLMGL
jgi:hypothetical protein